MQLSQNRTVNILFVVATLGILLSIVYLSYASTKTAEINKPYLIAYSKDVGVVFNIDKTLYHTDTQGHILSSKSLKSLGLETALGDIEIVDDYLLVTQGSLYNVVKCRLPLSSCEVIAEVDGSRVTEALDIAVTPDKKYFYVSSSKAHKIDYYTIDGAHIFELKLNEVLNYPNGIVAFNDGELVVADTNNHRIIGIKHKQNAMAEVIWELPVQSSLTREGFNWPTTFEIAKDRHLWVVNLDGFFEYGDVIIYEKISQPFEVQQSTQKSKSHALKTNSNVIMVDLVKNAQPQTLKATENGMLIGDAQSFKIIETSVDGLLYKEFGDAQVIEAFKSVKLEKEFWDLQITLSQYAIGFSLFLLILAALLEYVTTKDKKSLFTQIPEYQESSKLAPQNRILPDEDGVVWLSVSSVYLKKTKLFVIFIGLLIFVTLGLLLFMDYSDKFLFNVLLSLSVFSSFVAWLLVTLFSKIKIGVKERRIYILNALFKKADDAIENIQYSGNRIIVKGVSLAIKDGQGNLLFDKAEFSEYILPLLKELKEKSELSLFFEKLKAGDTSTWLEALFSFSILVSIFLYEFYLK